MQVKKYRFCDCAVEIRHSTPIAQKNNYNLFVDSFDRADCSCEVIETDSLPEKTGVCLFKGELNSVYLDGENKKTYTAVPVGEKQIPVDFACKINNEKLYISYPKGINEFFVFEGLRLFEILLLKGVGVLHCSFVEHQGKAILFAGDKQVGKSTQAALWKKYAGATVINGDRAGVFVKDGTVYAGGVPYCGTSGICINKQLPVKAIVCLSKDVENNIRKLSQAEGFAWLLGKFAYNLWDEAALNSVADILTDVIKNVPVYSYSCVKDESAVDFLKNALERMR